MKLTVFIILASILFASYVYAIAPLEAPPDIDVPKVLNNIAGILISIATPIGVIMVIIAGFYFMTAQGDPVKIEIAKKMFIWVLIGMAVVLLAKASISLVVSLATG